MQVAQFRLLIQFGDDRLRVVGVTEQGLAGRLAALAQVERADPPVSQGVAVDLHHLGLDMLPDQVARRAFDDDAALVDDADGVAQALRLVHEMGGQEQGLALANQPAQALPDQMPGLRVEAGGGLVEDHQIGVVDQGAGQGQPAFHAAGQRGHQRLFLAGKAREVEQIVNPGFDFIPGQAEIAAVDEQVFPHREIRVQAVDLRYHTDPRPGRAASGRHGLADQFHAAGIGRDQAQGQAQGGGLAGAIGAEQAVAFAGLDGQIDAIHHGVAGIGFGESGEFEGRSVHAQSRLSTRVRRATSLP